MHFSSEFWNFGQYRLRKVVSKEDISTDIGWKRHWHPLWVVDSWSNSKGWIRVKGKRHARDNNSVGIYPPRVVYEESLEAGNMRTQSWVLLEEVDAAMSPLRILTASKGFSVLSDPTGRVRNLIDRIHETALTTSPGQPHLLQGQTTQLVGVLINLAENHSTILDAAAKPIKEWVHPWKRIARSELEKTFPKMLTVDTLAIALKVAPSTLTHKYRTLCGETFKDTVQNWRMEKTIALLQRKDISMKEIATRLGMAHASHLTSFVKKHTGHSPSELRRISQSQID